MKYSGIMILIHTSILVSYNLVIAPSLILIDGAPPTPGTEPLIPIKPFMPGGVGIDPNTDSVFITEPQNDIIKKFTNNGVFVKGWGGPGGANGKFSDPKDVAVDSTGNIFVTDGHNNRIQKFQLSNVCPVGTIQIAVGVCFVKSWGTYGTGNGQFEFPFGIDIDSKDSIFVVDAWNQRIQKFDNNGNFITKWGNWDTGRHGEFQNPDVIAIDPKTDEVYVHDSDNYRIQKFDNNGNYELSWEAQGTDDGQFGNEYGIVVDPGNVYGIAVDPKTHHVYVSDTSNSHIQKFTNNTAFVTSWGEYGATNGKFNTQSDLDVDSKGDIFVADLNNHRVQKFNKQGSFISKFP
jgi:DNA-binding beta-propeller fold protein YncE